MTPSEHSSGSVPIVECTQRSYEFLRRNFVDFLPAAMVVTGIALASALLSQSAILQLGFALIVMLAQAAFATRVFRVVSGQHVQGRLGMSLGAAEFRQWVVALLLPAILFLALVLPVSFVLGAVLSRSVSGEEDLRVLQEDPAAMRAALMEGVGGVDALLLFVCAIPALWLGARLFVASAATFGEERIALAEAWAWSQGNAWRILASIVLVSAPFVLATGGLLLLLGPAAALSPASAILMLFVLELAATIARLPILALAAILYQGLRP